VSVWVPCARRRAQVWIRTHPNWSMQLGLVCTAGVAPNKVLAKLASLNGKPDGCKVIDSAAAQAALLADSLGA
jgi:nucleotidyltransferase/DNA polymerase involved in DNA repair